VHVIKATEEELRRSIDRSREAYLGFRTMPAPRRGEILRQIREAIAKKIEPLGSLVSLGGLLFTLAVDVRLEGNLV
jgi:aldehyde dehydrogenase family 7 member A1